MIVLADSSPLITLAEIDCLELLPGLYESITITSEVYREVAVAGRGLAGAAQISSASWIQVRAALTQDVAERVQTQSNLGAGELSTIVLAAEMNADLTLIDDSQARRMAEAKGVVVFGSVGVLETAFRRGFLSDLVTVYRKMIASQAYISPKVLNASLLRLKQPPL